MSSDGSTPSDKMDTRFSTPAPELDDHRGKPLPPGSNTLTAPSIEVHQPTPSGSTLEPSDLLHVDEVLRRMPPDSPGPIARDFEHAIADDDDGSDDERNVLPPSARRGSIKNRRFTNRGGRPRDIGRHDRSRDTSSSASSSPANSVEAFAETRRRPRANTAESHAPSFIEFQRNRANSAGTNTRRPTLSNASVPGALTLRTTGDSEDDNTFPTDDEPGKTYKIDFEELEEFVALSAQGKIPGQPADSSQSGLSRETTPRVFHDLRGSGGQHQLPNVMMNGESFLEKPFHHCTSNNSSSHTDEKAAAQTHFNDPQPAKRFTFFSSEVQGGLEATKLGGLVSEGTTFRDLFDVGPESGVWWLDVLNPTKAELEVLAKAFKIHRLTREDIETQEAREKVELFSQYYFVCFRSFNMDRDSEDFLDPIHLYIVVCADGILSFSYTPNPHAKNVRRRIAKLGDFVSLGPDYICYALIDDIVDSFAPIIREAEHESESIEDQVFIAREDDFVALLKQIGECRKRVLLQMRLLGGKADVIKGFAKRCNEQYDITPRGDIGLYLGDIQDHVVTMMSNLTHVEKMLSRSHANYLAQLNVDNILRGNHTNKTLAKITVVATILVPLNLITGLFGMNVNVPGKETGGLGWFFGIIGIIVSFVVLSLVVARRFKAI